MLHDPIPVPELPPPRQRDARTDWVIPYLVRHAETILPLSAAPPPPSLLRAAATPWPCRVGALGLLFGLILCAVAIARTPQPRTLEVLPGEHIQLDLGALRLVPERAPAPALAPPPLRSAPSIVCSPRRPPLRRSLARAPSVESPPATATQATEATEATLAPLTVAEELGLLPVPRRRNATGLDAVAP